MYTTSKTYQNSIFFVAGEFVDESNFRLSALILMNLDPELDLSGKLWGSGTLTYFTSYKGLNVHDKIV
jgi:hypothetical protein